MNDDSIREMLVAQLIAFITFLAYPALQYISLKVFSRKEGIPELWYLPAHGFRLVARNIPGNRVLSEAKLAARYRKIIPASSGSSVASSVDEPVYPPRDEFFVFPGSDLTLISFLLGVDEKGELIISITGNGGQIVSTKQVNDFDCIYCDYIATIENPLNFVTTQ